MQMFGRGFKVVAGDGNHVSHTVYPGIHALYANHSKATTLCDHPMAFMFVNVCVSLYITNTISSQDVPSKLIRKRVNTVYNTMIVG